LKGRSKEGKRMRTAARNSRQEQLGAVRGKEREGGRKGYMME
jgi:hypothetical protein